jgi:hypothetical protein
MLFQIHGARTDSGVRVLPPQPRSRLFRGDDGRGRILRQQVLADVISSSAVLEATASRAHVRAHA